MNTGNSKAATWFNDETKSLVEVVGNGEVWLRIKFQDKPISEVGNNGICMLDILDAMIDRLGQFEGQWPREENNQAILKMKEAKLWLKEKRENRRAGK